jgi:hypothetical protein
VGHGNPPSGPYPARILDRIGIICVEHVHAARRITERLYAFGGSQAHVKERLQIGLNHADGLAVKAAFFLAQVEKIRLSKFFLYGEALLGVWGAYSNPADVSRGYQTPVNEVADLRRYKSLMNKNGIISGEGIKKASFGRNLREKKVVVEPKFF